MRLKIWLTGVALAVLGTATLAFGEMHRQGEDGLAALMQKNRQNLEKAVQTAYLEGVERQLKTEDYRKIAEATNAIAEVARQARQEYSRGEEFNKLADDLREHAQKAAGAASEENHPEVNVEIGEMAEYCAACHQKFRW